MFILPAPFMTSPGHCHVQTYLNLAELITRAREEYCISSSELARLIGYRNLPRGARRIESFQRGESFDDNLVALMAKALNIPQARCELAWFSDWCALQRQWTNWIDEPILQHAIVALGNTQFRRWHFRRRIPLLRPAERYAARIAYGSQQSTWLIFSRRTVSELDQRGRVIRRIESLPPKMGEEFVEFGGFAVPGWTRHHRMCGRSHHRFTMTDHYGTVTYINQ